MHDERVYAERALMAGARGYVSKVQFDQTVLAAIRRVLGGEMYLSPASVTPAASLATPRQHHIAVRPTDSDRVLIAGGSAAGQAMDSAEMFVPSTNAFEAAPEATATEKPGSRLCGSVRASTDATTERTHARDN